MQTQDVQHLLLSRWAKTKRSLLMSLSSQAGDSERGRTSCCLTSWNSKRAICYLLFLHRLETSFVIESVNVTLDRLETQLEVVSLCLLPLSPENQSEEFLWKEFRTATVCRTATHSSFHPQVDGLVEMLNQNFNRSKDLMLPLMLFGVCRSCGTRLE